MTNKMFEEIRIDLPPAVFANFHSLAYNNQNGYRGILIGELTNVSKIKQGDHETKKSNILCLRVEAILPVSRKDIVESRIFSPTKLVQFLSRRIPDTMRLTDVQVLGHISYLPNPTQKDYRMDKKIGKLLHCSEIQKPKVVLYMDSIPKEENICLINSLKGCMWDKSGWRENIDVNVLNIRNMTTCDYMKPRPDSTFSSGDVYKPPTTKDCLGMEIQRSHDNLKHLARKIFKERTNLAKN